MLFRSCIAEARAKLETSKRPQSTDAELKAATQSVEAVNEAIETRAALEKKDKGYAAQADRARNELGKLAGDLEFARQANALRHATVDALAAGTAAARSAAEPGKLRSQKEHYEKALARFRSCESEGTSQLADNAALASAPILLEGQPSTPKEVIARCRERAQESDERYKQVALLVQFDEGPKRAYEAARKLVTEKKKPQAITQFEECISSGLILQNRSPEMKERKFQVAGASMTLAEVTGQCISQRKALRAAK